MPDLRIGSLLLWKSAINQQFPNLTTGTWESSPDIPLFCARANQSMAQCDEAKLICENGHHLPESEQRIAHFQKVLVLRHRVLF